LFLPIIAYTLSSTKLEIRPGIEGVEREGGGRVDAKGGDGGRGQK
jgi:hypothetical protein